MNLLTEESPRIEEFTDLKIKLKPHQNAIIYKTFETENIIHNIVNQEDKEKNNFLILADSPGAGKTNAVLGHLYYLKKKLLEENFELDKDDEDRQPSWIIVPQNILTQWMDAINKYFPKKFKVKKLTNYTELMSLYKNTNMLFRYDIILTTPLEYHMLVTTLNDNSIQIERIIFDEIDTISSMLQSKIHAKFIWFVSASFKSDRVGSYYSQVSDELIEQRMIKCDNHFISSCFPIEDPEVVKYVSVNKYIDETLSNIVTEEELRGMNAMDYTKMRNEYFKKIPFSDESAIELILEENKLDLETKKIRVFDMENEIQRLKKEINDEGIDYSDEIIDNEEPRVCMYREYTSRIESEKENLIEQEKRVKTIKDIVSKNRICFVCCQYIDMKMIYDNTTSKPIIQEGKPIIQEGKPMKEIFRSECSDKNDYCIDCVHWLFDNKKIEIEMKKKEDELKKRRDLNIVRSREEIEYEREEKREKQKQDRYENMRLREEIEANKEKGIIIERDFAKDYEGIEIQCKGCCGSSLKYSQFKKMKMVKRRSKEEKEKDRTSKIDRLSHILDETREGITKKKYIIFSDFYNTFRYVKDLLDKKKMKYMELDGGQIETIDKSVKEYREGDTQILLSNSTFFGCGLNMEFTTDIIFMHKMEKGTEKQVIGRAQRPGRTNKLKIHYIYYNNEEYGKEVEYNGHTQFYMEEDILTSLNSLDLKEVVFNDEVEFNSIQ